MINHDYLDALERSKKIAKKEYKFIKNNLSGTKSLIYGLKSQIDKVTHQGNRLLGEKDPSTLKLQEISNDINHILDAIILKHQQSVEQRAKKLENFTVMLFGRTMAGKSTIREAITGGDGSTIGKGAQRTTRDIKEYEWKNLRVIDTPGFGAWGGEEDTALAHSIVEESDLILFLLSSDSVQLSTIKEMKRLCTKNKSIIFILNVKQDLTKNIHLKRFLKSPECLFSKEKIGGHIQRLEELARDELGIRASRLKIIPIHAQAAYLSKLEKNPKQAKLLLEASKLPALFDLLSSEISINGSVRRIQSLLDSSYGHLDFLDQHLIENKKQLIVYSQTINEKIQEFDTWFNNYDEDIDFIISRKVDGIFSSFKQTIGIFVDDNIEKKDFDKRWREHLKNSGIESGLQQVMDHIQENLKKKIDQFNREVKQDIEFSRKFKFDSQNTYDPLDYKRLTGWGGAIVGSLASIAFFNSWNPVGWGFAGAAAILGIFNFFSESRESKLKKQKSKVAKDIRKSINKQQNHSEKEILKWFKNDVKKKIVRGILKDTKELVHGIDELSHSLEEGSKQCNKLISAVNSRLIRQTTLAISDQQAPNIRQIVRIPGEGCFFTIDGYFRNPELMRKVGKALNEIISVVYDSSPEKMISHALGVRHPSRIELTSSDKAIVSVPEKLIGKVIGRQGWRVKLVTALLNIHIKIIPLKSNNRI